jgi:hypothetical protein
MRSCNTDPCLVDDPPTAPANEWDHDTTKDDKSGTGVSAGILAASIIIIVVGTIVLVLVMFAIYAAVKGGGSQTYSQL